MKYQVLARKYRPKTFTTMMGQEHVLKALSNALESERLHHAYLFTGTRGVGKTTVARVLAKALNCEQGISASPCGECAACQEIDQGRFVDLIEVDAASRTKVEDTRELLDNVQYAPTRGRFKIYLIDEVHMLSGHSFNALLKTLEEPPPHVKFLLATTDPQKLPVTILSRCLQFNLKSLTIEQLEQQLAIILKAEDIPFENNVLKPLAIAADGSMRDALSLLDQAIAYSNGQPNLADIEAMLGSVQKARIFEILAALADEDGRLLITQSRLLTGQGIEVNTILAELITTLQRIALCQMVPDAIDDSLGDRQLLEQIAQHISPEDIQLYYQIALNGRKDLPFSPQPQSGLEMILLRMLAFKPAGGGSSADGTRQNTRKIDTQKAQSISKPISRPAVIEQNNQPAAEKKTPEKPAETATVAVPVTENKIQAASAQFNDELPPLDAYAQQDFSQSEYAPVFDDSVDTAVVSEPVYNKAAAETDSSMANVVALFDEVDQHDIPAQQGNTMDRSGAEGRHISQPLRDDASREQGNVESDSVRDDVPCGQESSEMADYWHKLINRSALNGLEQQLAKHCALIARSEENNGLLFELLLDSVHKHLHNDKIQIRLIDSLEILLKCPVQVHIKECQLAPEDILNTPRRREIHEAEVLQQQAIESIYADPKVQLIVNSFAAKVRKDSIKPV